MEWRQEMAAIIDAWDRLLGIEDGPLNLNEGQMLLRAVIIYLVALAVIRIGDKRFLGKSTAFDVILGVVLGSVMSRAITGSSAFLPSIVAGTALVAMHWLLAFVTFRSPRLGNLVKGVPRVLIEDGERRQDTVRASHITEGDLLQALRSCIGTLDIDSVDRAYLERSGDITIIPRQREVRVLEVQVQDGVQTIRIELG
jgi:uncharacterized membrane protein YcaP (DUF421 family)